MDLSWVTVKLKLENKDVFFLFRMHRKLRHHDVNSYVKERKSYPTDERAGFLSSFKIAYCRTVIEINSKSVF